MSLSVSNLIRRYENLEWDKYRTSSEEVHLASQIAIPIIFLWGQAAFIIAASNTDYYESGATVKIVQDTYQCMFNFVMNTTEGRQFAEGIGYNLQSLTFDHFSEEAGVIVDEANCSLISIDKIEITKLVRVVALTSSVPFLLSEIANLALQKLPLEVHPREKGIELYLEQTSPEDLTSEEQNILKKHQRSLCVSLHRWKIILALSGVALATDCVAKYFLASYGHRQLEMLINSAYIFAPGLPAFCSDDSICEFGLTPKVSACFVAFPSNISTYGIENCDFEDAAPELEVWKIWTLVWAIPLSGSIINRIGTIYKAVQETCGGSCRRKKTAPKDNLEEL